MPNIEPSALREAFETLGDKVASARLDLGFTQESLAIAAGITRKQLQNIEYARASMKNADGGYGIGNPKLDTVLAIASALGVDVSYLVDPTIPKRSFASSDD